jgi:hypothetical protein
MQMQVVELAAANTEVVDIGLQVLVEVPDIFAQDI